MDGCHTKISTVFLQIKKLYVLVNSVQMIQELFQNNLKLQQAIYHYALGHCIFNDLGLLDIIIKYDEKTQEHIVFLPLRPHIAQTTNIVQILAYCSFISVTEFNTKILVPKL